ncbi:hypothetical protein L7F22_023296 [Adiantum nelumboides]|nr:hypothetical protein [Adiantum nelumboides]
MQVFAQSDEAKIMQAKVDEAVEEVLDKVYAERDTFDDYDSDGYLACYRSEMKLMGISTKHMIKEFDRLIALELRAIVQVAGYDEFWEEIHTRSKAKANLVPKDHASSNLAQGYMPLNGKIYESDKEVALSNNGESFDDMLKSLVLTEFKDKDVVHPNLKALEINGVLEMNDSGIESTCGDDMEVMNEEANGLPILIESFCDDIGFFDSLLSKAGDDVYLSFSFDTGMLEDKICKVFDRVLDEEMPFEMFTDLPKDCDFYSDTSNVFKVFVCLFVGMYAFQCLLKAVVVAGNDVMGVSKVLECDVAYIDPYKGRMQTADALQEIKKDAIVKKIQQGYKRHMVPVMLIERMMEEVDEDQGSDEEGKEVHEEEEDGDGSDEGTQGNRNDGDSSGSESGDNGGRDDGEDSRDDEESVNGGDDGEDSRDDGDNAIGAKGKDASTYGDGEGDIGEKVSMDEDSTSHLSKEGGTPRAVAALALLRSV